MRNENRLQKALATGFFAASALFGSAAMAAGPVQLTFRQFDPPTETAGLIAAVDAWNAGHPDIQVKLETLAGSDTLAQLAREVPAGTGPDIQHLAFVWTRNLARSNLLLDLGPLISEAAPGAGIDDFLARDLATLDGKIYGIPWTADTFALAYRPDLLKAKGVSVPDTWEDLASAAKTLTDGKGQYGVCFPAGSAPDSGIWFLANYYLWSHGSTLLDETETGTWRVAATAADLTAALKYFNGFFEAHTSPESLITVNAWGDPELVGGLGRCDCAISFFPPQTFRAAEGQSKEPLATAQIPAGPVKRISHLGGRALGINPNSVHQKEAWEFIRYLLSDATFKTYNQYPAQNSVLSKLDFPKTEQGYVKQLPLAQTFERYISSPVPVPSLQTVINREFGAVFSGQRTAEQAGEAIVNELNALIARSKT